MNETQVQSQQDLRETWESARTVQHVRELTFEHRVIVNVRAIFKNTEHQYGLAHTERGAIWFDRPTGLRLRITSAMDLSNIRIIR